MLPSSKVLTKCLHQQRCYICTWYFAEAVIQDLGQTNITISQKHQILNQQRNAIYISKMTNSLNYLKKNWLSVKHISILVLLK